MVKLGHLSLEMSHLTYYSMLEMSQFVSNGGHLGLEMSQLVQHYQEVKMK